MPLQASMDMHLTDLNWGWTLLTINCVLVLEKDVHPKSKPTPAREICNIGPATVSQWGPLSRSSMTCTQLGCEIDIAWNSIAWGLRVVCLGSSASLSKEPRSGYSVCKGLPNWPFLGQDTCKNGGYNQRRNPELNLRPRAWFESF